MPINDVFNYPTFMTCSFVIEIIHSLISRGRRPFSPESPSTKTLRWFDYFVEFFLERYDEESDDDILFFIREAGEDGSPLFVKRRVGNKIPRLEGIVLWEETAYINLISRMICQVRVTIAEKIDNSNRLLIKKQQRKRVFAEPTNGVTGGKESFECSYPLIYFCVDQSHEIFENISIEPEQILCVELCAYFREFPPEEDDDDSNKEYFALKDDNHQLMLFQGAVAYSALAQVHRKKVQVRLAAPQSILMKGPEGKGLAKVQVTDTNAESMDTFDLITTNLRRAFSSKPGNSLRCCLTFINIHWRLIILDLYRHAQTYPSLHLSG